MEHRLSAEQRRALVALATSGPDGVRQAVLSPHGLIAGLINRGLATIIYEMVGAGGKMVEIIKVRITAAGHDALAAEN